MGVSSSHVPIQPIPQLKEAKPPCATVLADACQSPWVCGTRYREEKINFHPTVDFTV